LVEEKHRSEETKDPKKKQDKMLENHQADQDIVQVVQPSYSPSLFK
jgi:hypothetical protein